MRKWIIFDCMETLVDMTELPGPEDYAKWAFENSEAESLWTGFEEFYADYRKAAMEIESELPRFREYEMKERYERALKRKTSGGELERMVRSLDEVFWERYSNKCYVRKSVLETVEELCQRYPMGVVSNFKVKSGVRALLEKTGLSGSFRFAINSCEIGWKKPHISIYETARDMAGVGYDKIIFVGDDIVNDYEKPKSLGCRSFLYDPLDRHKGVGDRIVDFRELLELDI